MKNALEKKLHKLQSQKDALDAQIRHIEKERAQELRQLRQKKYALIGKIVLTRLEAGEELTLESESDLLGMLDIHLIRKSDRKIFGLPYPATSSPVSSPHNHSTEDTVLPQPQKTVKAALSPKVINTVKKTSQKQPTKTNSRQALPNASSQSDLAQEFNL